MLNSTWAEFWDIFDRLSQDAQNELLPMVEQSIGSMPVEKQIKALDGAPAEVVKIFQQPIPEEEWAEAQKRWNEIKEKK